MGEECRYGGVFLEPGSRTALFSARPHRTISWLERVEYMYHSDFGKKWGKLFRLKCFVERHRNNPVETGLEILRNRA